jgi:anaerobic magnesium-protoporphyrin IX monomethyl ester cyclase
MRILLIQPSEKMVIGKRKENGSIMPPLGLLTIASAIKKNLPHIEVELRDYEANNGEESVDFKGYDLIGFTGTSVHMPHAYNLIREARKSTPTALIIIGGPHATFCDRQLLNDLPELDAVCRGEGEISLVELLDKYKGDRKVPNLIGISSRVNLSESLSPKIQSLDDIPPLDFNLINLNKYQLSTHRKTLERPFASLMTSRGCPNKCVYCQTPNMFGNNLRFYSPNRVRDDISKLISEFGIRSIVFWDDTFTANRNRTITLCEKIKDFGINWMCNTRVECVDEELLGIMFNSGCRLIFFGVETSKDETIKLLQRSKISLKQKTIDAFAWCKRIGILTIGTIMIGAPGDSQEDLEANISFLKSLKPDHVYISIYNVTPGSSDFKRAINDGSLRNSSGRSISRIDWGKLEFSGPPYGLPTVNRNLDRADLKDALKWAYRQFGLNQKEYE